MSKEFAEIDAPVSFVFQKGSMDKELHCLMDDFKKVMLPFTAPHLKSTRKNNVKDFIRVSKPLGVTHFVVFSQPSVCSHLKFIGVPEGPTLDFELKRFSLIRDVQHSKRDFQYCQKLFLQPPLLVMNGFDTSCPHENLTIETFKGMFPSFDVETKNLNKVKRVLVLNYDRSSDTVNLRHFGIEICQNGISKGAVSFLQQSGASLDLFELADMSKMFDINFEKFECNEEEENDDRVQIKQRDHVKKKIKSTQVSVRLHEIGPRLDLKLVKIQQGVLEKEVLYHAYIKKTDEEILRLQQFHEQKTNLKIERKRQQEENVLRKRSKKN